MSQMLIFRSKSFAVHYDPGTNTAITLTLSFQREAHYIKAISSSIQMKGSGRIEKWFAILEENSNVQSFCSPWDLKLLDQFLDSSDSKSRGE